MDAPTTHTPLSSTTIAHTVADPGAGDGGAGAGDGGTTMGTSTEGALSPQALRARTRTNAVSGDTVLVSERSVPGTINRPRSARPAALPTSTMKSSADPVSGPDHCRLSDGAVQMAHGSRAGPGGAVHGVVVSVTGSDGALTPPAVVDRTRTCHVPTGTRVATKRRVPLRATASNTVLSPGAASMTKPDDAGPVAAGLQASSTRSSTTVAVSPIGGSGVAFTPTLKACRLDGGLRPASFTATSSTW